MVTAGVKPKFTYEDYYYAPEDKRYELHDGDLVVVPAPKEQHQDMVGTLYYFSESLRARQNARTSVHCALRHRIH